jgi:hypothetical protein
MQQLRSGCGGGLVGIGQHDDSLVFSGNLYVGSELGIESNYKFCANIMSLSPCTARLLAAMIDFVGKSGG